ncbi:MAG: MBL fold metallo-hydrolase [Akkermansiaceae bacterium]
MNDSRKILALLICTACLMALPHTVVANVAECGLQKVTKRIYVIVGSDHNTCPEKQIEHPLTNPSIVIGESGVIIVDPGSSLQVGRLLLSRLRSITDKPVVAVFNTHIHGLYWLGNQAVKEQFPAAKIYAHKRMIERIEGGEGDFWVEAITGKYEGETTHYVLPEVSLSGGETLSIGGLDIKIHHTGHAHTDHDIMIEIEDENALFLGGLVVEPEVPSEGVPQDANFKGQMAATQYATNLKAELYIPGRGNPAGVELPKRALNFLTALYGRVQRYYDEGLLAFEISDKLRTELSEYKQWYDFDRLGGVVSQMYLQVEDESF